MAKRIRYNKMELGISLKGEGEDGGALNIAFLNKGRLRVWANTGDSVVLPESEVLEFLRELIKLYPLDALGSA